MPEPRQPRNQFFYEHDQIRILQRQMREAERRAANLQENRRRQEEAERAAAAAGPNDPRVFYWEDTEGDLHRVAVMPQPRQIWFGNPEHPVDRLEFPVQQQAAGGMADPANNIWRQAYGRQDQVQAMPAPVVVPEPVEIEEDKDVKVVNEFLIGCDPELIGIKDGKHANASTFGIPQRGPVGWDHGGDVIEIRPRPAKTAYTLSLHLKDLVKTLKGGDKFRAGAYFKTEPDGFMAAKEMTLGGHVHIDVPFELVDYSQRQRVAALDEVTHRLEELDVLTKAEMPLRRTRGKAVFAGMQNGTPYGAFGDVKSADGANRLEYRTMPSWLYSPVTTFLALTSAKLAAAHPEETLRHFMFQPTSKAKLRGFFELFSDKDVDAKRAVEMIFEANRSIVRDPDVDVVKTWEKEWKQIA